MLEQELIESAPVHMIGVVLRQAKLRNLAEADHVLTIVRPMRPDRAVFVNEFLLFHDGQETDLLKNARRGAEQRFTHVSTRVHGLVYDQVFDAGSGQISAERRTGRATADNNDLRVQLARG